MIKSKICKADDCNNPRWAHGYCKRHDQLLHKDEHKRLKLPAKDASSYKKPKAVSVKQQRINAEYTALRATFLKENSRCRVCLKVAVDVHHSHGRGINTLDTSTWVPVCREHHDWIHSNEKEAAKLNLFKSTSQR